MIRGIVSADREATIRLTLRGPDSGDMDVEFVIDTGFNGWITLPSSLVSQLGLPWRRRGLGELADGSESIFDIFEANVFWDGQLRRIWVDEMNASPMAGMSLLVDCELTIQVWADGDVTITTKQ
jgi:clan AA aspartic protease